MSESGNPWITWRIKKDGRGHVDVKDVTDKGIEIQTIAFDSLDQVPENIANAIRSDGRTSGSIP